MRLAPERDSATDVVPIRLEHFEMVRLDPDRLVAIYADLGEAAAEAMLCRAMEELAQALADLQHMAAIADLAAIPRRGRAIARIGTEVGMPALARVATDVAGCASRGDMTALAATMERLMRLADRSLTAIWDMQDLTH